MTLAIEAALAIGRKYWGHISAVLAVLLLILGIRGCGREAGLRRELAACLAKPPSVQYQTVTVTAKATQSVKIVYRDGSPCPDVEAVNTAEGGATVAQGQNNGSQSQPGGKNAVFLGAGWGSNGALAVGSVNLGPIQVQGGGGPGHWHAGAAWRVLEWP